MRDHGVVGVRPDTPTEYASGIEASPEEVDQSKRLWAAMDTRSGPLALNRHLLALTEVLLSATSTTQYAVAVDATPVSDTPVRTLLKEYAGSSYLLAVNIDAAPVEARFTFDQPYHIRPLFTEWPPDNPHVGQEIFEKFQPFDTRVYRLSLCLDPNADGSVNVQDVIDLVGAVGAEAGFSPQYDIDWDYSGNGTIDWKDVQIFIDDSTAPLPGCLPCQDSDGDGFSDCQAYFLPAEPCGPYTRDLDNDGCADGDEPGPDQTMGGRRDPLNPWDFYDVNGDGVVTLFGDIIPVAEAFGPDTGPDYAPEKDRSPPPAPGNPDDPDHNEPWDLGPPDGVITVFTDILGVANQFGHDCR